MVYTFKEERQVEEIRLIFDSDLNRPYDNMPAYYPLVLPGYKTPDTLIKEYLIDGEDENGAVYSVHVTDNRKRFVKHKVNKKLKTLRLTPVSTHGCEEFRHFGVYIK